MTREEATAILNHNVSPCLHGTEWGQALDIAIKALEQIPKLQNRCYSLTKGVMCGFCKYECEYKADRSVKDE